MGTDRTGSGTAYEWAMGVDELNMVHTEDEDVHLSGFDTEPAMTLCKLDVIRRYDEDKDHDKPLCEEFIKIATGLHGNQQV